MMAEQEEQSVESIIERLRRLDPKRNLAFVAVAHLKTPEEMRAFMVEYAQLIATEGKSEESRTNPIGVAMNNIGYVTVLISPEASKRWSDAFEGLPHPYFGDIRNVPDGEVSYAIGQADQIIKEGN